ncbi:hypothetical protein [Streptomyces sp. CBMA156]|uniref:hypothetical protein n=1 Tax=Streptomyces sp. CBMA156 TaxID=1930280 RepID=UPI001661BFE4|nr:hypothetical protein [Streptomyces sp. CBMA156]MBD0670004.1 hypothetical protein [Streptomyces sp. CBMA156]MBD0674532.1 hypothetical protein [Streptomyces sp. CBMA156]
MEPSWTAKLTIELSREHLRTLEALAELYHATPERMVASWAVHQIDRLAAGLAPDPEPRAPDAPDG